MRIYYFKGPVVIFGLLFPLIMFLTFFIGRNLDLILFFPGFLGMMLFFTASSVGPLITPWEKREKTYERLVSLPVILESIIIGDLMAGAIFGIAITAIVFAACRVLLGIPVTNPGLLGLAFILGSVAFAALGTLLASPTTANPSNIMMLSSPRPTPAYLHLGDLHPAQPAVRPVLPSDLPLPAYLPCRPVPCGAERECGLSAMGRYHRARRRDNPVRRKREDHPETESGQGDLGTICRNNCPPVKKRECVPANPVTADRKEHL